MSINIGPFEKIASILTPDTITGATSPHAFYKLIGPAFQKSLLELSQTEDANSIFELLSNENKAITKKSPLFILFAARKSRSKKKSLAWYLVDSDRYFIVFDPVKKTEKMSEHQVHSAIKKDDNSVKFHFIDGGDFTVYSKDRSQQICDLVNSMTHFKDVQPINLLLQCLHYFAFPIEKHSETTEGDASSTENNAETNYLVPRGFKTLNKLVREMFTQPDYYPVRSLFNVSADALSKRRFATSVIKIHSNNNSLCFYLNVITAIYFLDPPNPQEIFRGDSLLTNSLAAIRDLYAPMFFKLFAQYLVTNTANKEKPEEILDEFLKIVETICIPTILRWLCWMIFHEAKRVMPDGDGPYYAVSGFFFLRGLGPLLASIEDPDDRKRCILVTGLINFSSKPYIQPFIVKFKKLISKISLYVEDINIIENLPDEESTKACEDLIELFIEKNQQFLKHVEKEEVVGQHPILWFLEREVEELKRPDDEEMNEFD